MRRSFILFSGPLVVICMFLGSCGPKTKTASQYDNIPATDKECLKALSKAKAALAEGKLVYCNHAGSLGYWPLRSRVELESLLAESGIEFKEEMTSDVVVEGQTQWCYCGFMEEQIATKFGKGFIDSLIDVSDDWFVKNAISNGDTVYYGECDVRPRYPGDDVYPDDDSDSLQADVERALRYPRGYTKLPDFDSTASGAGQPTSFVDLGFFVDTLGRASLTRYWSRFAAEDNHHFDDYFEQEITKAVRRTGWSPALIHGRKVNADMNYRFYFE